VDPTINELDEHMISVYEHEKAVLLEQLRAINAQLEKLHADHN